jgi:hypothetical protein
VPFFSGDDHDAGVFFVREGKHEVELFERETLGFGEEPPDDGEDDGEVEDGKEGWCISEVCITKG